MAGGLATGTDLMNDDKRFVKSKCCSVPLALGISHKIMSVMSDLGYILRVTRIELLRLSRPRSEKE